MKIYIAGRITDDENAYQKFKEAENKLVEIGHTPLNPMKNKGFEYAEYIAMGIAELGRCEAIYMLQGWEKSKGAVLELQYANVVGLQVIFEKESEV